MLKNLVFILCLTTLGLSAGQDCKKHDFLTGAEKLGRFCMTKSWNGAKRAYNAAWGNRSNLQRFGIATTLAFVFIPGLILGSYKLGINYCQKNTTPNLRRNNIIEDLVLFVPIFSHSWILSSFCNAKT